MADVLCLGEALIDLVPMATGVGLAEADTFVKAAGGAPANVAVGLARLGVSSGFIGCCRGRSRSAASLPTRWHARASRPGGLRAHEGGAHRACRGVARQPMATATSSSTAILPRIRELAPGDIDAKRRFAKQSCFTSARSASSAEPARAATLHAVDLAHRHGVRVSFDPNLRLPLVAERRRLPAMRCASAFPEPTSSNSPRMRCASCRATAAT